MDIHFAGEMAHLEREGFGGGFITTLKLIYQMKGYVYSRVKLKWKPVYQKAGLKWRGDTDTFKWEGTKDELTCYYKRIGEGKDAVTVEAVVVIESKEETDFYYEAMDFWEEVNECNQVSSIPDWCGVVAKPEEKTAQEEYDKWYKQQKFSVENLKTAANPYYKPAPEAFYLAAVKDLEERALVKREELGLA